MCLELSRSYDNLFMRNASKEVYHDNLTKYYGAETAARLIHFPMMNCGGETIVGLTPTCSGNVAPP